MASKKQDLLQITHYAQQKKHVGIVLKPTIQATFINSSCGDSISITGIVSNNYIIDLKFQATGCSLSCAAAHVLVEQVLNQKTDYICNLTEHELLHWLGDIQVGPVRLQCALTPLHALKKALNCHAQPD